MRSRSGQCSVARGRASNLTAPLRRALGPTGSEVEPDDGTDQADDRREHELEKALDGGFAFRVEHDHDASAENEKEQQSGQDGRYPNPRPVLEPLLATRHVRRRDEGRRVHAGARFLGEQVELALGSGLRFRLARLTRRRIAHRFVERFTSRCVLPFLMMTWPPSASSYSVAAVTMAWLSASVFDVPSRSASESSRSATAGLTLAVRRTTG